jgi:hypothetical protein
MMTTMICLLMAIIVNNQKLFDFSEKSNLDNWLVVNDDVMGGRSTATFQLTAKGSAIFKGKVSLENYGGFSSIRYKLGKTNIGGNKILAIRLKGDGKNYQVRIREKESDYFSYITTFQTSGEWETVEVPLQKMYPSFRGRKLDRPDFNGSAIVELTFLIGNKKAEEFTLELREAALK